MKNFVLLALLIFSIGLNAQIKLDKTFGTPHPSGPTKFIGTAIFSGKLKIFVLSNKVHSIVSPNSNNSTWYFADTIFNSDYSVYKSSLIGLFVPGVIFTPIIVGFGGFCKNVFDNSNKIIYWVKYYYSDINYNNVNIINYFDEDGNFILKLDSVNGFNIVGNVNTGFKLITNNINNVYSIYSLPGKGFIDTVKNTVFVYDTVFTHKNIYDTIKLSNIVYDTLKTYKTVYDTVYLSTNTIIQDNNPTTIENSNSNLLLKPFPDPSSSFINIPYSISSKGTIKIYNSLGVLVNIFTLLSSSNSIIIDISKYSSGIYSFEVLEGSSSVSSGKFDKN